MSTFATSGTAHHMQPTSTPPLSDREDIAHDANPLGLAGIEFIEYATSKPQALGHVLEMMGFRPIARHRSREVMLYRQGQMNVIVNAHDAGLSHTASPEDKPVIAAIALRVRDAHAEAKGSYFADVVDPAFNLR